MLRCLPLRSSGGSQAPLPFLGRRTRRHLEALRNRMTELSPSDPALSETGLSPAEADHRTDLPVPEPTAAELAARAPVRPDSPAFSEFDINPEIVAALEDVGIVRTFAIQELTLPIALAG